MAIDLEEQKKLVLPYLQRAEEIAQVEPKVAYYCRLYAIDQGLRIASRAKEIDGLLKALLVQLEKDKQGVQLDAANDRYACETFALNIFKRADKVDRAGRADVNTSKAYYAASIFLEILNQFGEIDSDLFEKQRYAVWRAAEIRKAAREGRPAAPPPSVELGASQQQPGEPGAAPPGPVSPWDAIPAAPAGGAVGAGAAPPDMPSSSCTGGYIAAPSQPGPAGAPAACAPATEQPLFRPGSKVLHCPGGGRPLEPGTVGKVTPAAGPGGQAMYMVALRTQIVEVPGEQLAPELPDGTCVLHCPAGGTAVGAVVLMTEVDQWPPVYILQRDDGEVVQAPPAELQRPQEQQLQQQPAYPSLHAQPAAPAAPPPAPPSAASPRPQAPAAPVPARQAAPLAAPAPSSSISYSAVPGYQPPLAAITEAQKAAKYAASSLSFEDVASAVKYLNDALRLLTVPGAHK